MARRAVLMIVDGMRADLLTHEWMPATAELAAQSRCFTRHRPVFPSATRVNSASIATGCHPARHGLHGNAIALDEGEGLVPVSVGGAEFRERWRRATGRTLHAPTLSERLRAHGGVIIHSNSSAGAAHMQDPDGHGTLYHRSGSHRPGFEPVTDASHPRVGYDAEGDREITRRFVAALDSDPAPALDVLWICEPDHSQHTLELGSPTHRRVLAEADERVAEVAAAVERRRAAGDEVLFIAASDHGHETVSELVPVTDLMVAAGLKESAESREVVLASSGMGALVYLSEDARERRGAIAAWLRAAPWCDRVFAGADLAEVGLPTDTALQVAFAMASQDRPNRFGVPGLGAVAWDRLVKSDAPGLGQHGGLGRYETNPFLLVSGPGVAPGVCDAASSAVDIAPTILAFLGHSHAGTDGSPLALA
jgi:predicted AlkP superfamily pyrophosphatase or phosphodiesterase